jgi:hypothetical protein
MFGYEDELQWQINELKAENQRLKLLLASVGRSWIDTTELLPPLKTPILFVVETEVKYGQRGIYTKDDFECQAEMYRDGEFEIYRKEFVTKWMFLPKM